MHKFILLISVTFIISSTLFDNSFGFRSGFTGNNRITHSFSVGVVDSFPAWFLEHMEKNIRMWIASNDKYKSDTEVYTSYGIEWKWGLDKSSFVGRLFGMIEGREIGDFLQFRQYWDNGAKQGKVEQFGFGGITALGNLSRLDDGFTESIQEFSLPNGLKWNEKHITVMEKDVSTTTSYEKTDSNTWKKKRNYRWIKQPKAHKTELFMLSIFHFDNPGLDMVKTMSFDILNSYSQQELDDITDAIKRYNPDKIFVEWLSDNQFQLDSLYNLYLQNTDDFSENEQMDLKNRILQMIKDRAELVNNLITENTSLKNMLRIHNSSQDKEENINAYTGMITEAGSLQNHIGAHFASSWYSSNIHIWSLIQKQITLNDEKVMILFGAGHTAIFEQILSSNKDFKIVNYTDVVKN